ncbi:MAG: glutamate racemase [Actinomycetota bacterium]|nr:glutamate racemase [Actinomycetota bacterium]
MDLRPIGVFDSGLGGITVLKEIINLVPNENIIYFGDTARFPYGPRELSQVKNFALKIARFLVSKNVKMIVIACNTSTAAALSDIKQEIKVPVIGVIEPGARAAVNATESKRVGVIATKGTVESMAYDNAIKKIDKSIDVFSNPAPLLVDYVEKGIFEGRSLEKTICEYLNPLFTKSIDVLLLGCTHFPLIENNIKNCCSAQVKVISSAVETAKDVEKTLKDKDILNNSDNESDRKFYTTADENTFFKSGKIFLGEKIKDVSHIDIDM